MNNFHNNQIVTEMYCSTEYNSIKNIFIFRKIIRIRCFPLNLILNFCISSTNNHAVASGRLENRNYPSSYIWFSIILLIIILWYWYKHYLLYFMNNFEPNCWWNDLWAAATYSPGCVKLIHMWGIVRISLAKICI